MTNRRWLAAKAIVFGVSLLASATLMTQVLGEIPAGLFLLSVTAVRGAMDFYEHGLMTPVPEDGDQS